MGYSNENIIFGLETRDFETWDSHIVSRLAVPCLASFGAQNYEKRKNYKKMDEGMPKKRTFAAKF